MSPTTVTMMMHQNENGLQYSPFSKPFCNASAVVRLAAGRVHGLVEKGVPRVRKAEGMCVRVCRGARRWCRTALHRQAADRFVASVVPIASFVSSLAR